MRLFFVKLKFLIFVFTLKMASAQSTQEIRSEQVSVITSGEGKTSELAINTALRDAIARVMGTFVSSKTVINNDSLISDEFVNISSGNVTSYKVISQTSNNDIYYVVVSSTVSPEKIVLSAAAKTGTVFELSGGLYYQNILKEDFYKKQELIALEIFYNQWKNVQLFDYEVQEGEMFRFSMPYNRKITSYAGNWLVYLKDLVRYNKQQLITLLKEEIEDEREKSWYFFPGTYEGQELFQIPYKIKIYPNENYFKYIKAYVDLLYILSIKNIQNYKTKYGDPAIYWRLVYGSLLASIKERLFYISPEFWTDEDDVKSYPKPLRNGSEWNTISKLREGHIALRNHESIKILDKINSIVFDQNKCAHVYIEGINHLTFPPAFSSSVEPRNKNQYGLELLEFNTYPHSKDRLDDFILPYPTDRESFIGPVYCLLTFTKDELPKINNNITFNFKLQ